MSDTPQPPDISQQGQTHITTSKVQIPDTAALEAIIADAKVTQIPAELVELPQKISIDVTNIPQEVDLDLQQAIQTLTLRLKAGDIAINLPRDVEIERLKIIELPPHTAPNKPIEVHIYYAAEALSSNKTETVSIQHPTSTAPVIGQIIQAYVLPTTPITTDLPNQIASAFELPKLTIDDPNALQQVHDKIGQQAGIILQNETALDTAKTLSNFMADNQKSLPINHDLWLKTDTAVTSPSDHKAVAQIQSPTTIVPATPETHFFEITAHRPMSNPMMESTSTDNTKTTPQIQAVVAQHTPQNFPILTLDDQSQIIVQQPLNLKIGDNVTLQPVAMPQQMVPTDTTLKDVTSPYKTHLLSPTYFTNAALLDGIRDFIPGYSQTWDALDQAVKTLQDTAPQAAQAVQNSIPTPGPRIAPTALFFLMAMKMGRVENWLGDKNINALQNAGKADLVDKLRSDFTKITNRAQESIQGDWKHLSLPMLFDEHISAFQMYIHDGAHDSDNEASQKKQKRFIIDFQFSQLGPLQVDGLLTDKHLDLNIKSETPLSTEMRQDIRQRFKSGVDEAELTGDISFQTGKDHFFTPAPSENDQNGIWI